MPSIIVQKIYVYGNFYLRYNVSPIHLHAIWVRRILRRWFPRAPTVHEVVPRLLIF
jgi:hypothetical protein